MTAQTKAVQVTPAETQGLMQRVVALTRQAKTAREHVQSTAGDAKRKLMIFGSSYVLGLVEGKAAITGQALPSIAGLDPALLYGGVAYAASQYLGGDMAKLAAAATDAVIGVYGYKRGVDRGARNAMASMTAAAAPAPVTPPAGAATPGR